MIDMLCLIVNYLILSAGIYQMFCKSGEHDKVKAFVPGLNYYHMFRMYWSESVFYLFLGTFLIGVLFLASHISFVMFLGMLLLFFDLLIQFLLGRFIAKAFGRGRGCILLFTICPPLAVCYIGFGSSKFYGKYEPEI